MQSNSLSAFLLDRGRRCVLAGAGLILFSYGFFLQLQANMGLAPWNALNQGLSFQFGFSLGTASILMSVLIIVIDLLMGETIGLGTILDALIVGWFTDLFVWCNFPAPQTAFFPNVPLCSSASCCAALASGCICWPDCPAAPGMPCWWPWASGSPKSPSAP